MGNVKYFIHRRLTLQKIIVDLGLSQKTAGLLSVALSRVKKLSDYLIESFSFDRFKVIYKEIILDIGCRNNERLIS